MRLSRLLGFGVLALALAGCETTVETEVSFTDLLGSESKLIAGELYLEVAGCHDFEDSRKPSSAVIEAQQKVPAIFADAQYEECFSKQMDSFARFTVPIALNKDNGIEPAAAEKYINLVSKGEVFLGVAVPERIRVGIERESELNFGMNTLDLGFNIRVNNDTGEAFPFTVIASYVDDAPYIAEQLTASVDSAFVVGLSDVSVSTVMEGSVAPVLMR